MNKKSIDRRTTYIFTILLMVVFGSGYALAAGLTITNGAGENGSGVYHTATNAPVWWTESSVGVSNAPAGTVSVTGSTPAAPQVLAGAAATYGINAITVGDVAQFWKITEAAGATANSELEISFTVVTGAGSTVVTVYMETQAAPPGSTVFTFYDDVGSGSSGPVINNVQVIWLQCSAVGTCP